VLGLLPDRSGAAPFFVILPAPTDTPRQACASTVDVPRLAKPRGRRASYAACRLRHEYPLMPMSGPWLPRNAETPYGARDGVYQGLGFFLTWSS
jgi:hypothetical protein